MVAASQIWAYLIDSFLWQGNVSSYFILINDYILHRTGLSADEVAFGITILGMFLFRAFCVTIVCMLASK